MMTPKTLYTTSLFLHITCFTFANGWTLSGIGNVKYPSSCILHDTEIVSFEHCGTHPTQWQFGVTDNGLADKIILGDTYIDTTKVPACLSQESTTHLPIVEDCRSASPFSFTDGGVLTQDGGVSCIGAASDTQFISANCKGLNDPSFFWTTKYTGNQ